MMVNDTYYEPMDEKKLDAFLDRLAAGGLSVEQVLTRPRRQAELALDRRPTSPTAATPACGRS